MKYYDLLMRRVLNRIIRDIIGMPIWVTLSIQGVGGLSYRYKLDRGTLLYNYTDILQFYIVPVPLDMSVLELFGQLFYHGELGSLKLHRLSAEVDMGMKLLKEYPI